MISGMSMATLNLHRIFISELTNHICKIAILDLMTIFRIFDDRSGQFHALVTMRIHNCLVNSTAL